MSAREMPAEGVSVKEASAEEAPAQGAPTSKMELLAPAGGMDQLKAAVYFGADAVYIAGERFGMRARAHNFNGEHLISAIHFAHSHNVKLYVACNIFMHDSDIAELPKYLEFLDCNGVDGLIISDLGAFKLAQKYAPHTDIHISTQFSVSNAECANAFYEMGAKRIVCAREMSLEEIAAMRKKIPTELELEVFVHGAMCMAVSGRCLISAYLAGRSANKGNCAQSCRWKYTLEEEVQEAAAEKAVEKEGAAEEAAAEKATEKAAAPEKESHPAPHYTLEEENRPGLHFPIEEDARGTYIMNAQDLNMIEHLDALARAGVNSIKIEGRNKKAFYVASVVGAYKNALCGGNIALANTELHKISHRPYSTGFFFGPATQANDCEGYIQGARHIGDVLFCAPCSENNGGGGNADGCDNYNGEHHTAFNDASGGGNDSVGNHTYSNDGASKFTLYFRCRNKVLEGETIEILAPHRSCISIEIKDLVWINFTDEGQKKLFEERGLSEEDGDDIALAHNMPGIYLHKVSEAARTCDIYSCTVDTFIPKHSYLRKTYKDPNTQV